MIHILAKRPDLQRELQKEMDTVIGSEREPRLSDRGDCPRIESFILETLRYISHLPLFVFHAASQSTSIGGYDVEKDTVVFEFITLSGTLMWPNATFVRASRLSGLILIVFNHYSYDYIIHSCLSWPKFVHAEEIETFKVNTLLSYRFYHSSQSSQAKFFHTNGTLGHFCIWSKIIVIKIINVI